ncbi:MAG: PEGA domain-containing protein [Bradymonadales bacterium]|nr:PEGA domain-containing protein [Bradymonadales bacterium]
MTPGEFCATPHRTTRGTAILLTVTAVLVLSIPSRAQEDPVDTLPLETVQRMLDILSAAEIAEREGQWLEAIDYYQQLYDLHPIEHYRVRQAFCLEKEGQYAQALILYRELENAVHPEIASSAAARAHSLAERLGQLPARLRILTDQAGASVLIDDQPTGMTTEGKLDLELEAGEHLVAVHLDGYQAVEQAVSLAPGEDRDLAFELVPLAAQAASDPPVLTANPSEPSQGIGMDEQVLLDTSATTEGEGRSYLWPILLGGSAVAVAGAGLAFGLVSSDRAEQERSYDRQAPGASREEIKDLADEAKAYALAANISFGVAGALAIVGAVTFFLSGDSEAAESVESALKQVTLSGTTVTFSWSW